MMAKPLDLFNFQDYRGYLSAWLEEARRKRTANLSRLAEKIGVHTSFLAHVLSGAKNLSFEQAAEVSDVCQHSPIEREYFFALLQIERAGTSKLKKYWQEKRNAILNERKNVRSRVGEHHELTDQERAIFYSSWMYVAIYTATAIEDGQTVDQIAGLFRLPTGKAREILDFLVQVRICDFDKGRYKMGRAVVFIPNSSPLVVKHHTNWRLKAMHRMDEREDAELFFTCPMSIAREDFPKIRELFTSAIEEALAICKDSKAEEVVNLNIDFFRGIRN